MILFDSVTKKYNSGHTALENISFEIVPGEFVFLMGSSGSGKTTLLRLILREVLPTEGSVIVANHDLKELPSKQIPHLRRQIGSAFQDFKLIDDKNAFENVAIALEIMGKAKREIDETVVNLLDKVGLGNKMYLYPRQLSGGEVQRVAIARAIAMDPVLLFADEPTGNLDPETSMEIIKLLIDINNAGTTVIMATHDVGLVEEFPHRKIFLEKGSLIKDIGHAHKGSESTQEDSDDETKAKPKKKVKKKKKKSKDES